MESSHYSSTDEDDPENTRLASSSNPSIAVEQQTHKKYFGPQKINTRHFAIEFPSVEICSRAAQHLKGRIPILQCEAISCIQVSNQTLSFTTAFVCHPDRVLGFFSAKDFPRLNNNAFKSSTKLDRNLMADGYQFFNKTLPFMLGFCVRLKKEQEKERDEKTAAENLLLKAQVVDLQQKHQELIVENRDLRATLQETQQTLQETQQTLQVTQQTLLETQQTQQAKINDLQKEIDTRNQSQVSILSSMKPPMGSPGQVLASVTVEADLAVDRQGDCGFDSTFKSIYPQLKSDARKDYISEYRKLLGDAMEANYQRKITVKDEDEGIENMIGKALIHYGIITEPKEGFCDTDLLTKLKSKATGSDKEGIANANQVNLYINSVRTPRKYLDEIGIHFFKILLKEKLDWTLETVSACPLPEVMMANPRTIYITNNPLSMYSSPTFPKLQMFLIYTLTVLNAQIYTPNEQFILYPMEINYCFIILYIII